MASSSENFIHLFERLSEPLGYGLRGGGGGQSDQMIYYHYDNADRMNGMIESDMMKETIKMVGEKMKGENVKMVRLPPMPSKMPDLEMINDLCPKTENFSYFLPNHRQAFSILKNIFMKQSSRDALFQMACACRDHPMINCQLFLYSLSSCLVSRPDTLDIPIPSHCEISPENYCSNDVVRQANKMSRMSEVIYSMTKSPPSDPPKLMIDQNLTARGTDREQRLWYFREDILVNSHHFHWHIVYPICAPKDPKEPGYRDRRGELFYYMHHSMIARYDTERLCNGLPPTKKFDFGNTTIEEGYFGKLSSENSGQSWGTRQANTKLASVSTPMFQIRVEDLARWRDRILECIDLGTYVVKDDKTGDVRQEKLDEFSGVDVLGNMIESSSTLTPHVNFYGGAGFHNMGHVLVACSNDPRGKHKENVGVMGDVATAMRDPAFYRWHKYIDNLFDVYKRTLSPYPLDDDGKSRFALRLKGIEVKDFYVKAVDTQERNVLKTFWDYKDIDLSRGLDFRRGAEIGAKRTPVMGRFTHLNHGPFDYFLEVQNNRNTRVLATVRIFMAPRVDESGNPLPLSAQRLLFFEMDKAARYLDPGTNSFRISSTNSSVTLKDEGGLSFKNLEQLYLEAKGRSDVVRGAQCSCGWPHHLLIPRGTAGGSSYDLFVIITDGSQDNLININRQTGCTSALSFCGVLNKKYPDSKPMGFPFDRVPIMVKNVNRNDDILDQCPEDLVPVPTLEKYVAEIKNSATVKVTVIHENMMKKGKAEMGEQIMRPDGKCMQLKDFYSQKSQNESVNNPEPINGRPTRPNRGQGGNRPGPRPTPWGQNQQQQGQWGGAGRYGPRGGRFYSERKGRADDYEDFDDEEWDQLDEYDN